LRCRSRGRARAARCFISISSLRDRAVERGHLRLRLAHLLEDLGASISAWPARPAGCPRTRRCCR
jgi:hypothetical protein